MKTVTKILLSAVAIATAVLQSPAVQTAVVSFVTAHPSVSTLLGGVATALALIHTPSESSAS